MKYINGNKRLGMPDFFKFGIEIEADNVYTSEPFGLYSGKSAEYITSKNWHMATEYEEALVSDGGAELVSPILTDSEKDWQDVADICEHMKRYPGLKGKEVVANEKCGLHVHFDSKCLTSNPKIFRNFMRLYAESEELLYKMCNDKNDPIRKGAINKNFNGIEHMVSAMWRNGMAAPIGKKVLKQIENDTLKVSYKKFGKLKMLAGKYKLDERRYAGLNLTNIGNPNKDTIEFRMANGTLNPEVIKQNVFLYASLINTAIEVSNNPEKYKYRLEEFYRTDMDEREKAISFLNLVIENPEDRKIYMDRWESVKAAEVYRKNDRKGFAQNRFTREQFESIAVRTPADKIRASYNKMKEMMMPQKDRGDLAYER